jgi:hypothetical protein
MNADGSDQTNLSNNAALDSGPDWQRLPIPIPPTVVIGACDSGVPNYDVVPGTTLNDAIAQCAATAKNHGSFVECVSALTNGWEKVGLITGAQKGAIMPCAAKAH